MKVSTTGKKITALVLAVVLFASITACKKATPGGDSGSTPGGVSQTEVALGAPHLTELQEKIKEAQAINPLVYGWIHIPGTSISEPVIYDTAQDNRYWETRNLEGEEPQVKDGSYPDTVVYASYRNQYGAAPADDAPNNVLFGHNWNNIHAPFIIGPDPDLRMFAQLPSFTDLEFSKQHQYIYFATEKTLRIYKVFSAMYCEKDWTAELGFNYIDTMPSTENFSVMLEEMQKRSYLKFDTEVGASDRIISLSTCSRFLADGGGDQRYVVSARLLRDGEEENALADVKENPDWKKPNFG